MESFFPGPDVERFPPEKIRLLNLSAEPDPDGKRLHLKIDLTPFEKKPTLELILTDSTGQELSSASIIEPMSWKLELTLHIRKDPATVGESKIGSSTIPCTLTASLSYPELGEVDRRQASVLIEKH